MKIMSRVFDSRINSANLYVETSFWNISQFCPRIIANNDLQRKRVKTSKTVYSLLKEDLKKRLHNAAAGLGNYGAGSNR